MTRARRISDWRVETLDTSDAPVPWRKAFFEGAAEWLAPAPNPHKETHLKRVFEEQKGVPPPRALLPDSTLMRSSSSMTGGEKEPEKRLRARVERLRNLREGVDPAGSAESASAGSTSSSDSSSDSDSSSESS